MEHSIQAEVTRLLDELQTGNRDVLDELFSLVYDELRSMAQAQRKGWEGDYTLNTTGLLHEAYLKLVDRSTNEWENRNHFLSVAAKAMRHILVDYARRRRAEKRGGKVQKVSLHDTESAAGDPIVLPDERSDELLALDEALERLAKKDPRAVQVVECRFFGAMTIAETAAVLGFSPRTVIRDWALAQAWLRSQLDDGGSF